ncbi:class I SAM-dependent methyltransferase [Massilia sp. Dwa41.01b]|uniref:class I SAM-dependent methyltransferase n=1 Tax=unclassified Massilia TaxID=2609279 RepID=UPI0016013E8F|nr:MULTISPECIES: class I SAM-dependent methyltransferase [unclassified Massilia]QNA87767.1 class I SAM-dependent methyltransferase [Massilia sp. Dwa41.01b]QNA98671.1 class I SAM-dependent methyltransferase [Massilia sp. Se16.2.3]
MDHTTQSSPAAGQGMQAAAPDFAAIKQRQQATWASGDFAVVGVTLQIVGESLAEMADIRAGENVLDVAAGNGNATLAAARRFARVTSTDYVPALLEKGRQRAAAEGLDVQFQVADAENLPFADDSFDAVLSTFGVMFAPDQMRCASELMRVVRPGGRVAVANWTPDSTIGQLFKIIGKMVPPPAGLMSPLLWGTEAYLGELFGDAAADIRSARRHFNMRYASPAHWLQVFRDFYGPVNKAFGALDAFGQAALERDILALLERENIAGSSSLVVPVEYLEAVISKRMTTH